MLGKLIKYELKASSRKFIALYGMLIAMAILTRLFGSLNWAYLTNLSGVVMVSLFVALGVITIVMMIKRFAKNLFGDEGYLMHTLPVKASDLILSKLISLVIWSVASVVVSFVTFIVLVSDRMLMNTEDMIDLRTFFNQIVNQIGLKGLLYGFEMLIFVLLGLTMFALMIYTAISIGQLFNSRRVLAGLIAYFIMNAAIQYVLSGFSFGPTNIDGWDRIQPMLLFGIATALALNVILFLATNYIVSKKLNLE